MKRGGVTGVRWLALTSVLLALMSGASAAMAQRESLRVAEPRIVLRTTLGDIAVALYPDIAPRHVAQMLRLVRLGVYDGTHFPRVERTFLVQVSDATDRARPLSAEQRAALQPIPLEPSGAHHRVGVVSMAHPDADLNGAVSSFVIVVGEASHLDGRYSLFGEVERGMDVVDAIANVAVDSANHPRERVGITRALVVESEQALREFPLAGVGRAADTRSSAAAGEPGEGRPSSSEATPNGVPERVVLETSMGDVLLVVDRDQAPRHVEHFLRLVRAGAYDSVEIGRVDPSYFLQVFSIEHRRGPLPPLPSTVRTTLPPEATRAHHGVGTVTMSASDPARPGITSALTFVLADSPQLDGAYTPIAHVERGEDVLAVLARVGVDSDRRPRARIEITRAYVAGAGNRAASQIRLRGPTALPSAASPAVLALVGVAMFLGLLIYVFAPRLDARTVGSLGLLVVLVGFFALFVALVPYARGSRALAVALFAGTLVVLRLMSQFESSRGAPRDRN